MTTRTLSAIDFEDSRNDWRVAEVRLEVLGSTAFVSGDVDAGTVSEFQSMLLNVIGLGGIETLDLSGVAFFGSDGAKPLKDFSRLFDGRLVTSGAIARVLGLLGIDLLTRP